MLASKRAKQIKEGAPILIDTASTNHLTIALEEIAAGKVSFSEHMETLDDDESPAYAPASGFGLEDAHAGHSESLDSEIGGMLDMQEEEEDQTTSDENELNAGQAVTAAEEA